MLDFVLKNITFHIEIRFFDETDSESLTFNTFVWFNYLLAHEGLSFLLTRRILGMFNYQLELRLCFKS